MSLTVNFCGDSFCASKNKFAWCHLLSKKINAKIIGLGKSGSAHEHAIKSFNPNANITIFCWTEPNRLYHKKYSLHYNTIDKRLKEPNPNKIYQVAKLYYRYLHDLNYSIERQYRDLYWFDHEHLSNYKGKILHFYCHHLDKERYQFKNGIKPIELFKLYKSYDGDNEQIIFNHFTVEDNKKIAEYIYQLL